MCADHSFLVIAKCESTLNCDACCIGLHSDVFRLAHLWICVESRWLHFKNVLPVFMCYRSAVEWWCIHTERKLIHITQICSNLHCILPVLEYLHQLHIRLYNLYTRLLTKTQSLTRKVLYGLQGGIQRLRHVGTCSGVERGDCFFIPWNTKMHQTCTNGILVHNTGSYLHTFYQLNESEKKFGIHPVRSCGACFSAMMKCCVHHCSKNGSSGSHQG